MYVYGKGGSIQISDIKQKQHMTKCTSKKTSKVATTKAKKIKTKLKPQNKTFLQSIGLKTKTK